MTEAQDRTATGASDAFERETASISAPTGPTSEHALHLPSAETIETEVSLWDERYPRPEEKQGIWAVRRLQRALLQFSVLMQISARDTSRFETSLNEEAQEIFTPILHCLSKQDSQGVHDGLAEWFADTDDFPLADSKRCQTVQGSSAALIELIEDFLVQSTVNGCWLHMPWPFTAGEIEAVMGARLCGGSGQRELRPSLACWKDRLMPGPCKTRGATCIKETRSKSVGCAPLAVYCTSRTKSLRTDSRSTSLLKVLREYHRLFLELWKAR